MENLNDDGTLQLSTWGSITESVKAFATGPMGTVLQTLGGAVIGAGQLSEGFTALGDRFPKISKGLGDAWNSMKGFASSTWDAVKGLFRQQAITATMGATDIASDVGGSIAETASGSIAEAVTPEIGVPETTQVASGPSIGDKLKDLASGLKEMGNAKVLFGALNLIPTALGFVTILPGIPGMLAVGAFGMKAGTGLMNLAIGLGFMGNTAVTAGAGNLALAAIGFTLMTAGSIGLGAIAILGGPAGTGLQLLGVGLASFGATAGTVGWLGVAVILALSLIHI